MKTTLNLDDHLLKKAKLEAARDGITLTRFVEDALRAKLVKTDSGSTHFKLKLNIIKGRKPPNVDIANRDALYDVIDNG